MAKRELAPDAIKGLCITLMVFGHVTFVGTYAGSLTEITKFIYTFHMPIFLIIAGYFFSYKSDISKRFNSLSRKIIVPYILFISLYLLGLIAVQKIGIRTSNSPPESIVDFISAVILHPYGGYWFLHSLIIIESLILISSLITTKISSNSYNVLAILLLALTFNFFAFKMGIIDFRTICYFIFGVLIRECVKEDFEFPFNIAVLLTSLILLGQYFSLVDIYEKFSPSEVFWSLSMTTLLWSIFRLSNNKAFLVLAWVGRNTLVILVLHALFIVSMKPFNNIFLSVDSTGVLQAIIVPIITISLCLISAIFLDLINASKFIFGQDNIYSRKG